MSLSRHLPVVFPLSIYQCKDPEPFIVVELLLRSDVPFGPRGISPRVSKGSNRLQHVLRGLRENEPSLTVGLVPQWVPATCCCAWKSNTGMGQRRFRAKHGHFSAILASLRFARTLLGTAKSTLGFAKTQLGVEKSRLGVAKMPLGVSRRLLAEARTELGSAKTQLGVLKSMLGVSRSQLTEPRARLGWAKTPVGMLRTRLVVSRMPVIIFANGTHTRATHTHQRANESHYQEPRTHCFANAVQEGASSSLRWDVAPA
jgi:hypothetical protein